MYIEKETRNELTALSKELFGKTQYWRKLLDHGLTDLIVTKETMTLDGKEQTINKPVLTKEGTRQFQVKYVTAEQLLTQLREIKQQIKEEKEKKAKEQQEKLLKAQKLDDATGIAIARKG